MGDLYNKSTIIVVHNTNFPTWSWATDALYNVYILMLEHAKERKEKEVHLE